MDQLRNTFHTICEQVGNQLGVGHSEMVYQKACGQFLQAHRIPHQMEQHVPVVVHVETPNVSSTASTRVFHVGDERIDILMYDEENNVHVVELKAIGTKVSPAKPTPQSLLSASHAQLLKYIRLLQEDLAYRSRLTAGYVVNFRQHVTHGAPHEMPVEFDVYDVQQKQWDFGYTPAHA